DLESGMVGKEGIIRGRPEIIKETGNEGRVTKKDILQYVQDKKHGVINTPAFHEIPVASFFSSRRRHTRFKCDWSSDVCSSDLSDRRFALQRPDFHFLPTASV